MKEVRHRLTENGRNGGSGRPRTPASSANTAPQRPPDTPAGQIEVTSKVSSCGPPNAHIDGLATGTCTDDSQCAARVDAVHQAGVVAADPVAAFGCRPPRRPDGPASVSCRETRGRHRPARWPGRNRKPRSSARSDGSRRSTWCGCPGLNASPLGVIRPSQWAALSPRSSRQYQAPTGAANAMFMHMVLIQKRPLASQRPSLKRMLSMG